MEFTPGFSKTYAVMRTWLYYTSLFFYRKSHYKNMDVIPKDAGIIIAPNHQSAFQDAIVAAALLKKQGRFLVRADVYKNPMARKALVWFNLLPIYRMRDGIDSMGNNEQIFKTSEDVILRDEMLVLFPEGNQANKWRLRALKKGYARIAFGALKKAKGHEKIYIIPTGVNYYHFTDPRHEVVVEYGEPIAVHDYADLLKENEAKAMNKLRDELSSKMKPLMFNIRDDENYDAIKEVSHLLTPMDKHLKEDFETRKAYFNSCGEKGEEKEIKTLSVKLAEFLKTSGVDARTLRDARHSKTPFFLLPIYWLISMITTVINAPIMIPTGKFVREKVNDIHFKASIKFIFSNYLMPIYYVILLGIISLIFSWGVGISIVLGMAIVSYFGILAKDQLRFFRAKKLLKSKVKDVLTFNNKVDTAIEKICALIK